jgi:hypothetical protein
MTSLETVKGLGQRHRALALAAFFVVVLGSILAIAADCNGVRSGIVGEPTSQTPSTGVATVGATIPNLTPLATLTTPSTPTNTPVLSPTWTPNVVFPDCITPRPLTPIAVSALPDEGLSYEYDSDGDGVGDTWVRVPPANFDVMTASDKDLARYGVPPRPTDPDHLSDWIASWGNAANWSPGANGPICITSGLQ